jgi:hypothetical protein
MNIIEISIIKKVLNILSKKKLPEVHVLLLVGFWIADYNFLHLEQNVPEQHMKPLISILIPILLTTISFLLISYLKTFPHLKPKFGVYWGWEVINNSTYPAHLNVKKDGVIL